MTISHILDDHMRSLEIAIGGALDALEQDAVAFDPDDAIDSIVRFTEAKAQLRDFEQRLNALMVAYMRAAGERAIEKGDYLAERKMSSTRKNWEHATLLEAVVNASLSDEQTQLVDPSTGEVIELASIAKPLIDVVVRNISQAAAIRDWRVTALRTMIPGLNPDNFCEVEKTERVAVKRK
jgi:orotidine-5'-phosphate decarboxylase